jgi:4-amino-4-deoxychorismate lyase
MKNTLFIETMRVEEGRIINLPSHVNRMRATLNEVCGGAPELAPLLNAAVPDDARKCRVVYGVEGIESVEFGAYQPRNVRTLRLVEADADMDYHLKYADRSRLTQLLERRDGCDEVLILKNGFVTDTSYSNVVFTDGLRFVTPHTYLLPGTMRAALLRSGEIVEAPVSADDIKDYTHVALINAMLPLRRIPFIPVGNICL